VATTNNGGVISKGHCMDQDTLIEYYMDSRPTFPDLHTTYSTAEKVHQDWWGQD